jgi:hypothetical protein
VASDSAGRLRAKVPILIRASTLRFALTVSPAPGWTLVAFGGSVLLGTATLWFNPANIDSAFGSILILQMFAASDGFSISASRGYFDPLLTSQPSRHRAAIGSLAAAVLPGLCGWLLLVLIAAAFGQWRIVLAPHRHVALVIVSVLAWAGGLALPRMAAGALWAFFLVTAALFRGALAKYAAVVQSPPTEALQLLQSALAFVMCPFLLLGEAPASTSAAVIGADLIFLLVVIWFAVRYVERRDYALMDPV